MTKLRFALALSVALIATVALAACGGDDSSSDLDPAEVLRDTFGGEHELNSGVFGMTASAEVPGAQGGNGEVTVSAPFNNNGEGEIPDVSLTVDVSGEGGGESVDFSGGGTLTPEGATIEFDGTDYEVPQEFFDFFAEAVAMASDQPQAQTPSLEELGFDPETWFTELSNEGTEDIDGAETVHVSGNVDIPTVGEDLINGIEDLGIPGTELPPGFDASQLGLIEGFIEEASFDIYSQTDDFQLRQLDFTLALENLSSLGGGQGPDGASFDLSVTIDEPNEEQDVALPTDTEPFADLQAIIEEELGVDLDEQLGALGALGGAGAFGGGAGGDLEDLPGVDQAYLDCLEKAKTQSPEALSKCAEEL